MASSRSLRVVDDPAVGAARELGQDVVDHLERAQRRLPVADRRYVAAHHQDLEAHAAFAEALQVVVAKREALAREPPAPDVDGDVRVTLDDRVRPMELAGALEHILRDHERILRHDVKRA